MFVFFFKIVFSYFQREDKGGRKRGRKTSMCERNLDQLALACPLLGTWLATQACALTVNRTSDLSVRRPTLNPLSHTSQGRLWGFNTVLPYLEASAVFLIVAPSRPIHF